MQKSWFEYRHKNITKIEKSFTQIQKYNDSPNLNKNFRFSKVLEAAIHSQNIEVVEIRKLSDLKLRPIVGGGCKLSNKLVSF